MTADAYRNAYPTDETKVLVGPKDNPFEFTLDPMSALGLFRAIYSVAQELKIPDDKIQGKVGRLVLTETEKIFEIWGPDALIFPKCFSDEEMRDASGNPEGLLTSQIRQTHKLKLITALLDDGGGGETAAAFRTVEEGGQPGTDVEGVRDTA